MVGAVPKYTGTGDMKVYGVDTVGSQIVLGLTYSPNAQRIPKYSSKAILQTNNPERGLDCANKDYVDNLPDNLTLTDEQKAKWKTWLESILA